MGTADRGTHKNGNFGKIKMVETHDYSSYFSKQASKIAKVPMKLLQAIHKAAINDISEYSKQVGQISVFIYVKFFTQKRYVFARQIEE